MTLVKRCRLAAPMYALLVSATLSACFLTNDGMCNIEVMADRPAPNAHWKAVAYTRDCGALSDGMTSVSILPAASELPNEYGNVFRYIDTTATGPTVPRAAIMKPLVIEWTPDGGLVVKFDPRADVNHKVVLYNTIPVEYREYE